MTLRGTLPAPTPESRQVQYDFRVRTVSSSSPAQFHYHMSVDFFFAVDIGCGSSKLQQLVRLVHDQRRVELTQAQQVEAEHSAETGLG